MLVSAFTSICLKVSKAILKKWQTDTGICSSTDQRMDEPKCSARLKVPARLFVTRSSTQVEWSDENTFC